MLKQTIKRAALGLAVAGAISAGAANGQAPTAAPATAPPASAGTLMGGMKLPTLGQLPVPGEQMPLPPGADGPPGAAGVAGPGGPAVGPLPGARYPGQLPGIPQAWAMSAWNPVPVLEIRTEAMFLRPSFTNSPTIALQPDLDGTGALVLSEKQIDVNTDFFITPRVAVEYRLTPEFSVDVNGFGMTGPNRTFDLGRLDFPFFLGPVTTPGGTVNGPLTPLPLTFPVVVDVANITTRFNLGNIEATAWRHFTPMKGAISDLAFGIGGRWLFFNEKVTARFEDTLEGTATPFGELFVRSKNDVYGVQLTSRAIVNTPIKRLRSTLEGKLGIMNDDARHETRISDVSGLIGENFYTRSNLAPLLEGNFTLEYFLTQFVTVYGGFQVTYIDRVERATEQFNSNVTAFTADQKQQSNLLLYGFKAGFLMQW